MEQNNYLQPLSLSNSAKPQANIPAHQFAALPYFCRFVTLVNQKQCRTRAQKCQRFFKLAKVKKGTVIYAYEDVAEKGYILISGSVQLLNKKNSRQKLEMFPGHILHNQEQRQNYLYENLKIPRNKAQSLMNIFYQDKILFKFLPFHRLYNKQQFGFGQMVRNTSRVQTAVALQDSQLLYINKKDFDDHLREFHYKKQMGLINRILQGLSQQLIDQIQPKMLQIMNSSALYEYNNECSIYTQNQYVSYLYFIIEGEVQIRKKAILNAPKKYMKSDNKQPIEKQAIIKVFKTGKGAFIGEQQIFTVKKSRSFSVVSTSNETLILKIDHNAFFKLLNDFPDYEKQLIENAVFKKINADQSYQAQYKKIMSSFISQYEVYESKKKQKLLSEFMKEDQRKKYQMFEVFAPEGVFYRDTFQKLQGFQEAARSPTRNQSIKRFKQKSTVMPSSASPTKMKEITLQKGLQKDVSKQFIQKILFSPKRNINIAEFYGEQKANQAQQISKIKPQSSKKQRRNHSSMQMKQHRQLNKFQQIKKDQAVFKRVLIKNGAYPIDKRIDKSQSAKALVHHNFDQVVKICVSRKNQALRRSSKQQQNEIVLQSYQRTLQNLKSYPMIDSFKFSRFSAPVKGVDELKKKINSIHNVRSSRLNEYSYSQKKLLQKKMQDCIGINEKPKSSQVPQRQKIDRKFASASRNQSPQKIVFLNHMMKPITYYNSTEI